MMKVPRSCLGALEVIDCRDLQQVAAERVFGAQQVVLDCGYRTSLALTVEIGQDVEDFRAGQLLYRPLNSCLDFGEENMCLRQ